MVEGREAASLAMMAGLCSADNLMELGWILNIPIIC